jgi:hypothetical protein
MKCAKHTDVETSLTCGRCETPVCVRCLTHTDVGIRCRKCAPSRGWTAAGARSTRLRNIIIIVGLVFVAVVLIGGGSQLGGGSNDIADYEQYVDDTLAQYQPEVTASRLIDPWIPEAGEEQPPPGRRFVALEVTIEYPDDRPFSHYVSTSHFKLIDSEDFASGATKSLVGPPIPEALELTPGQRTKGWVMFEIDEASDIKGVMYSVVEVALPQAESAVASPGEGGG